MGALPCQDAESLTRPLHLTLNALQAFVDSAGSDDQLRQKLHAASGLDDVVDLMSST